MADDYGGGGPGGRDTKKKRNWFMKIIGKIWRLKDEKSAAEFDREQFVKNTFKELIVYLVFLTLTCIISFSMASETMYYYTDVMEDLFLKTQNDEGNTFEDITNVDDFWKYARGPLIDGLYWNKWYNEETDIEGGEKILYENLLVGTPRLRQLRVSSNSCRVNPEFDNFITDCFSEYSESAEEKIPFGKGRDGNDNSSEASAWKWQEDLEGATFYGKVHKYPERGYAAVLHYNKEESETLLESLQDGLWIRRGARAVFVDFTVYNANINLFCVIRLAVEFPATGGALPRGQMRTEKLIRYFTTQDMIIFGCEMFFLLFIFYYLVEEVIEIADVGLKYVFDFWNLLDAALITVALICTGLNTYRYVGVKNKLANLDLKKHMSFSYLAFIEERFNNAVAILVFFAWVKVFKYISFNKTMTQLSTTLSRCAKDLLGFFIMFAIVFVAFTQLGYLLFGTQVKDFSTFLDSFFTLFRIILGDFDFHQLEQANRVLGPMFFMLFVFFVFFVLINMFLAIINDTYSEVKSDMAKQVDLFIMSDYIKQSYDKFKNRVHHKKKEKEEEEEEEKLKTDSDGKGKGTEKRMPCPEWKMLMLKKGHDASDIEFAFDKYEIDTDRDLHPFEQKKMLKDIERKAIEREGEKKTILKDEDEEEEEKPKEYTAVDDFMTLTKRVDRLETSMGGIISNIDAVLAQLATLKF